MKMIHIFLLATIPILCMQERRDELELFKQFDINVGMKGDWIEHLNNKLAEFKYPEVPNELSSNTLFRHHPALQQQIPYISLAALPTPVEKLEALSKQTGAKVYIKRDDLTGGHDENGNVVYGGNKARKLSLELAKARKLGAKKIMTFGCVASNHAVTTAVYARRLGMKPICMLKHQPYSHAVQHNLLMHLNYDTELHYNANNDTRKLAAFLVWLDHYKRDGQVPYIIPTGGSTILGTIGFVDAIFELKDQIDEGLMPLPSHIYVPCGSYATTAGILLGCKAAGLSTKIVAVAVEPDEDPSFAQNIDRLFRETNAFLYNLDNSFPLLNYTDDDLQINLAFTGPDYGIFTAEGILAAKKMLELEGIKLDGTYTAKAFACMLDDIQNKLESVVLFWDTYCGLDQSAHLKERDYRKLPRCFHEYFDEKNIQPLDQA